MFPFSHLEHVIKVKDHPQKIPKLNLTELLTYIQTN